MTLVPQIEVKASFLQDLAQSRLQTLKTQGTISKQQLIGSFGRALNLCPLPVYSCGEANLVFCGTFQRVFASAYLHQQDLLVDFRVETLNQPSSSLYFISDSNELERSQLLAVSSEAKPHAQLFKKYILFCLFSLKTIVVTKGKQIIRVKYSPTQYEFIQLLYLHIALHISLCPQNAFYGVSVLGCNFPLWFYAIL